MVDTNRTSMKKAADILILIGTILVTLTTVFSVIFVVFLFAAEYYGYGGPYLYYYDYVFYSWVPFVIIAFLCFLVITVFLVFSWVAYAKTVKNSKGWAIYGLVQAILSGGVVSIVGYVLAIVDFNSNPEPMLVTAEAKESIELNAKLAAAKAELAALRAAKSFKESQQSQNMAPQAVNLAAIGQETEADVVASPEAPLAEEAIIAEEAKQAE
ncbi:MAG: hypothetical protein PHN47_01045 [Clostridia bacterium]|jgi:hypothetical protein|nr:hypothetical protein [Clostridia bacterium]MDD4571066.1 hypothetical protein [Clostridia bacterium]